MEFKPQELWRFVRDTRDAQWQCYVSRVANFNTQHEAMLHCHRVIVELGLWAELHRITPEYARRVWLEKNPR